jgi:hypothetical protein
MTTILKDKDLTNATAGKTNWGANGWETCAVGAFNVVIYTYNAGAAYSDDGGNTFHIMDANGLCQRHSKSLFCDQVVTFIPSIDQFAWLILTTDQNLILAMASPREIQQSGGTAWGHLAHPVREFRGRSKQL